MFSFGVLLELCQQLLGVLPGQTTSLDVLMVVHLYVLGGAGMSAAVRICADERTPVLGFQNTQGH